MDHDEASAAPLRRGWTTGTCAAAAAKAACAALAGAPFPDPVDVLLPGGERPAFVLALTDRGDDWASAGIVKDAGDDPDVTHGALVVATVRAGLPGSAVTFRAGQGVGTVTRPGLPIPPGEPAINPVPRAMIRQAVDEAAAAWGSPRDVVVEIAVPGGEALALKTLNGRLGIVGGLSVLGTTGIVVPYSCAAWIHTIHRGIDVARAMGLAHVAGATGDVSEKAVTALHGLPDPALIDMGDFAGGMLKYLRRNPVPRVTVGGGFAKMTKLGQGLLDLHSRRGSVDTAWLAARIREAGGDPAWARDTASANEILARAGASGLDLAALVAGAAWQTAAKALAGTGTELDVVVVDRSGHILARTDPLRTP